jgi:hypothetical protein
MFVGIVLMPEKKATLFARAGQQRQGAAKQSARRKRAVNIRKAESREGGHIIHALTIQRWFPIRPVAFQMGFIGSVSRISAVPLSINTVRSWNFP